MRGPDQQHYCTLSLVSNHVSISLLFEVWHRLILIYVQYRTRSCADVISRNYGKRRTITPAVSEWTDRPVNLLWHPYT
jgi:hypothetical protein